MSTDLLSRAEAVGVAWPLTAERLVLRPFTAEDAEAVWSWWGLHETTDWTGSRYDSAAELADAWLGGRAHLVVLAEEFTG